MYTCMYVHVCMYTCMYVHVCMYTCMYVHVCMYTCMYVHVCMYTCMYVLMYRQPNALSPSMNSTFMGDEISTNNVQGKVRPPLYNMCSFS